MANRSVAMGLALAFVAMTALCCAPGAAELPRLDHPARSDGSLKLLVVGDWGRKGTHNQSRVADQVSNGSAILYIPSSELPITASQCVQTPWPSTPLLFIELEHLFGFGLCRFIFV